MAAAKRNETKSERASDTELVITRTFDAPARLVFEAWTKPELLMQWWAPKSVGLTFVSCEADVRVGGTYRFVFSHPSAPQPMAFFGRYLEVVVPSLLRWTNEEAGDEGQVSTLTLTERDGQTHLELRERYPSKAALDAAIASGSTAGDMRETFSQLDELLGA